jgi:hypothetical protein
VCRHLLFQRSDARFVVGQRALDIRSKDKLLVKLRHPLLHREQISLRAAL